MIIKVYFRPHIQHNLLLFLSILLKTREKGKLWYFMYMQDTYILLCSLYYTFHGSIQTKLLASCVFCVRSNDWKLNFQFILSTCYAKIKYFIHVYQYCALQQAIFPQTKRKLPCGNVFRYAAVRDKLF